MLECEACGGGSVAYSYLHVAEEWQCSVWSTYSSSPLLVTDSVQYTSYCVDSTTINTNKNDTITVVGESGMGDIYRKPSCHLDHNGEGREEEEERDSL